MLRNGMSCGVAVESAVVDISVPPRGLFRIARRGAAALSSVPHSRVGGNPAFGVSWRTRSIVDTATRSAGAPTIPVSRSTPPNCTGGAVWAHCVHWERMYGEFGDRPATYADALAGVDRLYLVTPVPRVRSPASWTWPPGRPSPIRPCAPRGSYRTSPTTTSRSSAERSQSPAAAARTPSSSATTSTGRRGPGRRSEQELRVGRQYTSPVFSQRRTGHGTSSPSGTRRPTVRRPQSGR